MNKTHDNFRIAVPIDYENVFSHFYFTENQSTETLTKTLLPSYQTILIFNFGAPVLLNSRQETQIEVNKCMVLGIVRRAFDYSLPPKSKVLVANFKDDAFYRFFGNTLTAKNSPINPDELLNENCFTALWNELNKINNPNRQVSYILDFCTPYLQERETIAEQLINFKKRALNPIKAIASDNEQTERNIQIKQKKYFGYSVKEINRYQRFLKAVEHIALKEDWFTIINDCGYHDQSQLIKDFKHYLNLSPTKYLKFQQDICSPFN